MDVREVTQDVTGLHFSTLPPQIRARIDRRPDGHWIWTGWHNDAGYGYVRHEGRDQPARRVVYVLLVGPVADVLDMDHLCRVTLCVNPAHRAGKNALDVAEFNRWYLNRPVPRNWGS